MLEKYKDKQQEEDLLDRKVYLVEFKFETILNEVVEYTRWIRLDALRNGMKSASRLELHNDSITVNKRTYNTKHIVHMDSEVIKEGYVKKSIKKQQGGYRWSDLSAWSFQRYHKEDQLEEENE